MERIFETNIGPGFGEEKRAVSGWTDGWIYRRMDGLKNVHTIGRTNIRKDGRMDEYTDGRTDRRTAELASIQKYGWTG